MTESASAQEQPHAVPAAPAATPVAAEAAAVPAAPSAEAGAAELQRKGGSRRGGRNRRKPDGRTAPDGAADNTPQAAPTPGAGPRAPQRVHPALEQLAALYPHLFGAVFRPLKRGIFQDILAAHPDVFEREALKVALGLHTRSTRYLQCVAAGEKRHDLAGQPVEAMAPEHVHHALLEVYRRRKNSKGRPTEDLLPKLRHRMMAAFESSGLTREAYTALVLGRDEAANAILEEAFAEWAARNAKDEALLRAFEASGQTLEAFADMYGLVPRTVGQQLERARRLAAARAQQAADAAAALAASADGGDTVAEPPAAPAPHG